MTMFLRADYSNKVSGDYSIFVTFQYNPSYVQIMKSLPPVSRAWLNDTKEWEVGYDFYTELITKLKSCNVSFNEAEFMKSIQVLSEKVQRTQAIQSQDANVDASILDEVEFKTQPYSYQREGIAYGLTHDKFLLADTQGLGKTLQCLNIARLKRGGKHCLIIVGYDILQWNWLREVELHTNEKAHIIGQRTLRNGNIRKGNMTDRIFDLENIDQIEEFFVITSVATLRHNEKEPYIDKKGKKRYNHNYIVADLIEQKCRDGEIGRIIYDECQTVKNYGVSQTEAFLRLKSCPYKIAATGTPIMNRHIDLWPVMTWLGYENSNYYVFRDRYCKMGGFKGKQIVGDKNGVELNKRLSQFMIRRRKEDVLDLPEKIIINEILELDGKQYALYEKYKRLYKQKLYSMKGNKVELLAATLNLRKITCNPLWLGEEVKENVKFERVAQLVHDSTENGEKTIIFSNWSTPINWLYDMLKDYNPAMITGDTKDRMEQVDKFQNNDSCKVILGTIGAMGTGVTLTAASNVIFIDEPWNRALKDQATDRAHRIGTKHPVNVYTLICRDTIDEMVHELVFKKGIVSDIVVDGAGSVSTEDLERFLGGNI